MRVDFGLGLHLFLVLGFEGGPEGPSLKSVRWVALGSSGVPFRLVLVSGLDRDPMGLSLKGDNLS